MMIRAILALLLALLAASSVGRLAGYPSRPRWKGLAHCLLALCLVLALPAMRCAWAGLQPPAASSARGRVEPDALTLEAAVQEALQANPGIQAIMHDAAAALRRVDASRGQRYGELDALLTAQHFSYPQLLQPLAGPVTPAAIGSLPFAQDQLHVGGIYTYPLYVGGRIVNQIRIAELGADKGNALLTGTRSDVTYNVTALFVQAQALEAQADALQREIDSLEVTRQNLELALKIGRAPEVDLLKVLDRISEAEAARMNTLAQRQRLLAALMSLLGRDPAQTPTLAPLPDHLPELAVGKQEMRSSAIRRSSVRAAELSAAQGERQIGVARSALGPTVSVQASYLQNADLSSLDISDDTWSIGVQVAAPIFDGGSRRADLSRSREEARALQQRAVAARLEAIADLEGALASWQSAQDQLRAADAQYNSAHEVARIEQVRFDTGAGDIEDLLRARSRETAAQSTQIAARAQIIVSGAQINRATESEAAR